MSQGEIPIAPGSEIYGMVYSDATTGGWHRQRHAVVDMIRNCKALGLSPVGLLRLRMKHEMLFASE